jgi:carbonic anhydrase/acetyltransferase-like protein (isoleucine patch superfamily)
MNLWITLKRILKTALYNRWQFEGYREKQYKNDVIIDSFAIISGIGRIHFGCGTTVGHDAIVASTYDLSLGTQLNAHGSGTITIGERCSIQPRAIIATYGGDIIIGNDVSVNPGCILYGHG